MYNKICNLVRKNWFVSSCQYGMMSDVKVFKTSWILLRCLDLWSGVSSVLLSLLSLPSKAAGLARSQHHKDHARIHNARLHVMWLSLIRVVNPAGKPAEYFFSVPALFKTVAMDNFSVTNHVARQVSFLCTFYLNPFFIFLQANNCTIIN